MWIWFLKDLSSDKRCLASLCAIYLQTAEPAMLGWVHCFPCDFFIFFFFPPIFGSVPLALHHPHKKTYQTVISSSARLGSTALDLSPIGYHIGRCLNITLLFSSFGYQHQAGCSAARAPYVARMMYFKPPCFNFSCIFSLPLAVCALLTFGAVTNGQLSLGTMMASRSSESIKWASLINSCAE